MKILFIPALVFCISLMNSCNSPKSNEESNVNKLTAKDSVNSDKKISDNISTDKNNDSSKDKVIPDSENTFEHFKSLFKEVELPYYINTDSIHKRDINIPIKIVKKWIIDTVNFSPKNELIEWLKPLVYDTSSAFTLNNGWFTISSFIKFRSDGNDYLFIETSSKISEVNGAYTKIYALTYSQTGKLIKIKNIGQYGVGIQREYNVEQNAISKRINDITKLEMQINPSKSVTVTTIDSQEITDGDYNKISSKITGTKHQIINLE
jgi:hypothetical protein